MERAPITAALARIDETACIGCTLCIAACPVDAIVGAAKLMHTVLAGRCTGCELCLPPCPVDCIELVAREAAWTPANAARAQANERARLTRLALRGDRGAGSSVHPDEEELRAQRRAAVAAALARARARRAASHRSSRA